MFGLSFSEILVIGIVALVAVGPQKLPGMLRTLGEWARKLRNLTHEMRTQSGIDEILRSEGLHGGLSELRGLVRGGSPFQAPAYVPPVAPAPAPAPAPSYDPYANLEIDATKEYPPEGPDAYDALPDDLFDDGNDAPSEVADAASEVTDTVADAATPLAAPADAEESVEQETARAPRVSTGS